jgi:hypothetical protein
MARIRTVKPEFWTSAQVMDCNPVTRLMFIGLWNFADDAGRMSVSTKKVKALIFPSDVMALSEIRRMLDELSSNGLIESYVIDDVEYLQITGWQHQKIDRPNPSKLPDKYGNFDERSTIGSERSPPEGKGREGKVVKKKQREES